MAEQLRVQLIVLDWAGTTIDFGCQAPTGAFVAAFAGRGVEVTLAEARGPMGLHKKDHLREMLTAPAIATRWLAAVGQPWTEADVDDLYRTVTPMQVEAAKRYSELVPGVRETVARLRANGVKIGATTGYFHAAAEVIYAAAERQGFVPDARLCADEVPAGRPAPWMIFRVMEALSVYPPAAVVKVGDTLVDIADGRNAGAWSVGVVDSSNEMGLNEAELLALSPADLAARRAAIRTRYQDAGAHGIIDRLEELPDLIASFNSRLANGERPQ